MPALRSGKRLQKSRASGCAHGCRPSDARTVVFGRAGEQHEAGKTAARVGKHHFGHQAFTLEITVAAIVVPVADATTSCRSRNGFL